MPWFHAVAERDHELQNPTSEEKIRLLGERLRLGPDKHVLDLASGRGGPALILAATFGCRVTGVERSEEFFEAACGRARGRGLDRLVEFVQADAREFPLERERYDVAMCLGASFVWGGLEPTLDVLAAATRRGGYVVVGEPFWRRPPEERDTAGFASLPQTVERFERTGLPVIGLIAASGDDWDRYETLHWRALEEWLAENAEEPDAPEIRSRYVEAKRQYLERDRDLLGWGIFAAWKR